MSRKKENIEKKELNKNKKKKAENKKVKAKTKSINIKKLGILIGIFVIVVILLNIFCVIRKDTETINEQAVYIDEIIGKTANKKVIKVQDTNGDIFYLPKGFKISDNISEQTVKDGLVIIDDTGDKETSESEFVWIPVNTNNDVFSIKESKYRTLDYTMLNENNTAEEYKNIQNSISAYGGFYISRYEAGISEKMEEKLTNSNLFEKQTITQDTTENFANGKYKPVSKSDSTVWNFIKWGGTFKEKASDELAGNDETNGAVKVARGMYNTSKTSVKSNLCYGFEWEAIMNFVDSNYYNNECKENSIIIDSSDYGNYSSKLSKTASDTRYSQKNIFDLAGNVWEWTMEGYSDLYRITRGGSYCMRGDYYSISSEKEFYPSDYYKETGFRVALWID